MLREIIFILSSYALGCFITGYYLVRWRAGKDIRKFGSASAGARNVGRELGPVGFATTFLLDFAKGAIAVGAGRFFDLGPWGVVLVMLAVVAGHIWPLQLRFRGGKGIATSIGAVLIYNYFIAGILFGLFIIALALIRNVTLGGLAAFALSPFALLVLGLPNTHVIVMAALAVLILIAHRENFREKITGIRSRAEVKESSGHLP